MNKKDYEENLKRRQEEHLRQVQSNQDLYWQPCAHDACPECVGTGVKKDGSACVHFLHCSCPKCTPWCFGSEITSTSSFIKTSTSYTC